MASLQIRDMPEDLYESLKNSAENDRRSLAQQALVLLADALGSTKKQRDHRLTTLAEIKSEKITAKSASLDVVDLIRKDRDR